MSENTLDIQKEKVNIQPLQTMAWLLLGLCSLLVVVGLILLFQPDIPRHPEYRPWETILQYVAALVMVSIGTLIIRRYPRLPIGWLFSVIALLLALDMFAFSYAAYSLFGNPGSLPIAAVMAEIADDLSFIIQYGLILVLLLFPDGRFLSVRWRIFGLVLGFVIVYANILWLLEPGLLSEFPDVINPFEVSRNLHNTLRPHAEFISAYLLPFSLFVSVISIIIRYRGAGETIRQQIKWFAFGVTPFVLGSIFLLVFQTQTSFGAMIFVTVGLISAPIAIAIAIFKYRLFEIDLIINRSLVYGALTALIIGLYYLSVSFSSFVVQTWDNLLGLLLTATVVVIFFKPVKVGIQKGVDRITMRNQPEKQQVPPKRPVLSSVRLSQKWLQVARVAWILLAFVALAFLLTSLPGYFPKIGSGLPSHGIDPDPSTLDTVLQSLGSLASVLSAVISLALAGLLFRHSFENPAVAAISFYLLLYSIIMTGVLEVWGVHWVGSSDFVLTIQGMLMATPTVALLVLFPNGKFVPRWTRWLLLISIPWNFIGFLLPTLDSFEEDVIAMSLLLIAWLLLPGLGLYAQIYRYRRVSTPDERQQTKWVLFGFALWTLYIVISTYPYFYLTSLPPGTPLPWWTSISTLGWWLSTAIIPVTMTIAVTRSGLWNIDVVINRTLVYGALTVATMALYVLVVGTLGNLLRVGNSTFIAFLTTGLVAILFQPIRDRLQRGVNRMMYGERDDPVAVLSKLGDELEHTGSPDDTLSSITEIVAKTLKLPYVAIELGTSSEVVASYGIPKPNLMRLPMLYQAETSGYLVIAPRSAGESFRTSELQLLENIAQQAGAAAHAAKLTADLRLSRHRLVTAREEERRRIRRDLHDGLGPQLASQTLTLTAARRMLADNPKAADDLLKEAIKHAQTATDDIRRVVYDLRPPALDDLGLIGAIQAYIHKIELGGLEVEMDLPDQIPTLPAAVEVACYLIVQEALANVIRHSGEKHCKVIISLNASLHIEIRDQGVGLPTQMHHGVGLKSMRQRAEELDGRFQVLTPPNGGTNLIVDLPLTIDEE